MLSLFLTYFPLSVSLEMRFYGELNRFRPTYPQKIIKSCVFLHICPYIVKTWLPLPGCVADTRFGGKKSRNFNKFIILPLEITNKTKPHPWKFCTIVLQKCETSLTKKQNPCFTQIFLDLRISTCFLINPRKFHMLFLNTPENSVPLTVYFFLE